MNAAKKKIGLALSGGGFRASLYHLGLVRFLRDAGILSQVTHITSVSGGSVLAAHLVLNWDRYNGSPSEFDAAARELIEYVRLDVRNRIARRFPLALPLRWLRQMVGRSNRKLTRTGLLEYHYEQFLYGDTSLFELPESPRLHILSTNLSEGSLASFNRHGLTLLKRQPGRSFRIEHVHIGLGTVAMAVTASSAFPGFFPPLELTGTDVGANAGEFGRQAFTDGGVFDNLAVRMIRCLERPQLANSPLAREDFEDLDALIKALAEASQSSNDSPLARVAQLSALRNGRSDALAAPGSEMSLDSGESLGSPSGDREELVLSSLWDVLCHDQLYREPLFAGVKPLDPDAEALFRASHAGKRILDAGNQHWLNRHLLEAAYQQATGKSCFRRLNSVLDGVLVSDVGQPIKVQANQRAGGLIRTALRATEILMDRVWQLENETFQDTPGFVFAPMTEVVMPDEDATALNPETQRQVAKVRTDMDRFSSLEISSLIRHGYCVARKTCKARPELFGAELPASAPWDPIPTPRSAAVSAPAVIDKGRRSKEPTAETVEARKLQNSASRRIWSTLLDYRDWASYIYVPIIVPILVLMPYVVLKSYQHSYRVSQLIDSLSQGSRDLGMISSLLDGPKEPWKGVAAEEVADLDEPDLQGFQILQDSRVLDLRNWRPASVGNNDPKLFVYCYQRLKVAKLAGAGGDNLFRMRLLPKSPYAQFRFPPQLLQPILQMDRVESSTAGEKGALWQVSADLQAFPQGEPVDIVIEFLAPGLFLQQNETSAKLVFDVQAETAEITRWLFLPQGKEYQSFRIIRYSSDQPNQVEVVKVVTEYLAEDSTILAYKLLAVDAGYTYEVTWFYK